MSTGSLKDYDEAFVGLECMYVHSHGVVHTLPSDLT